MSTLPTISGFDNGYPPSNLPWYGLWCPLLDCFLWCHYDFEKLKNTQALTFSKILTVLVQLDCKFYQQNIIDNSCAINWTLINAEAINFTLALKQNFHYRPITDLRPAKILDNPEAIEIQHWFSLVWNCLTFINLHARNNFLDTTAIAFGVNDKNCLAQEIYKTLLLELDIAQAQSKIEKLLETHE